MAGAGRVAVECVRRDRHQAGRVDLETDHRRRVVDVKRPAQFGLRGVLTFLQFTLTPIFFGFAASVLGRVTTRRPSL